MSDFEIVRLSSEGETVFVTYVGAIGSRRFRNTEAHTLRDGKVVEIEVYFGWNVPHDVAEGEHADPQKEPAHGFAPRIFPSAADTSRKRPLVEP